MPNKRSSHPVVSGSNVSRIEAVSLDAGLNPAALPLTSNKYVAGRRPIDDSVGSPASHLAALTGLRGALAIWVVLLHIQAGLNVSGVQVSERFPSYLIRVVSSGSLAVSVFFLLSGFVLSHVYTDKLATGWSWRHSLSFWALRLARVYPVHLTVLLCYVFLKLAGVTFVVETCGNPLYPASCDRFSAAGLWSHLSLVASWGWNPRVTWNPVAWSISSEWFAYLLFPLVIPLFVRVKNGMRALLAALASMGVATATIYWADRLLDLHWLTFNRAPDETGLILLSGAFACGSLLYRCYRSELYKKLPWNKISVAAVFAVALLLATDWVLLTLPFLAIMILAIAQPKGLVSGFFAKHVVMWSGKISYSLYMGHLLIMECLGVALRNPAAKPLSEQSTLSILGVVSFLIAMCVLFATVLYYGVEEPCRKLIRRKVVARGGFAD